MRYGGLRAKSCGGKILREVNWREILAIGREQNRLKTGCWVTHIGAVKWML